MNPKPTKPRSRDTGCSQVSAAAPKSKAVSPISAAAVMEAAWASRALRVDSEISRWDLLAVGAGWFSGLLIYDTVNLKTLDPQTLQP